MFKGEFEALGGTAVMEGHQPVMLAEVIAALVDPFAGERSVLYLDATFGGGGHTRGLLESHSGAAVVALDRDPEAVERAEEMRRQFGDRLTFRGMNFGDLGDLETEGFHGILLDLGLSLFQLEEGARGFSFQRSGPVDMRMDPKSGISGAEFLETAPVEELVRAIRNYGEEMRWRRVVDAIVQARGTGALGETTSLAALVEDAIGSRHYRMRRIHPATRTFQGIRIAINGELEALERVLPVAFEKLVPGGVLAVISFHSLEDRLVKRFMRRMAGRPEHARDNLPQQTRTCLAELISARARKPSAEEAAENPRSRSARLRLLRKLKTITT